MARSGRVVYRVKLDAPDAIEQIRLVRNFPSRHMAWEHPAMLFRYGRPVAGFMLSERQIDKVADRRGRIEIRQSQIDRYNHLASAYGG